MSNYIAHVQPPKRNTTSKRLTITNGWMHLARDVHGSHKLDRRHLLSIFFSQEGRVGGATTEYA